MSKISIQEVKAALRDSKFRSSLPPILKEDIQKYEQNPNCPCNLEIYRNILRHAAKELIAYYPNQEITNPDLELPPLRENNWSVINCSIQDLENKLKALGPGAKQLAITRWEDQVTVIVNELDA